MAVLNAFAQLGWVLLALIVFALLYDLIYARWYYDWKANSQKCGPVHKLLSFPFAITVMPGNLRRQREHTLLDFTVEVVKDHPTLMVNGGGFPMILTREPEVVKAVFSTQINKFGLGIRTKILRPVIGNGIFNAEGELWKHSRATLRPVFTRERVSKIDMLESHMVSFLTSVDAQGDQFIDAQRYFFKFTMDSALEFLFGVHNDSFAALNQGIPEERFGGVTASELSKALNFSSEFTGTRRTLGALGPYYSTSKFRTALKTIHAFADAVIAKVLLDKAAGKLDKSTVSFVSDLAETTDDLVFIRDQALTAFLAGRSTTALLLTHFIYMMSTRPEMWRKVREAVEIDLTENPDGFTFEALKSCRYLNWAINETLRLHPLVPLNVREALVDVVLPRGGGQNGLEPLFVPKGMTVGVNFLAMHKHPDLWGLDAEEFIPERWAEIRPPAWSYLPFGGGPRVCLGQQFALTEVSYIIARLAQEFTHIVPGDLILRGEVKEHLGVSPKLVPGLDVKFVR